MLCFDSFFDDVSEGNVVNKTSASKECDIYHYWDFINYTFTFQANVNNRCHDLLLMSMKPSNIVIFNIKSFESWCITNLIRKNETINSMTHKHSSNLTHKRYLKSDPQTLLKNRPTKVNNQ